MINYEQTLHYMQKLLITQSRTEPREFSTIGGNNAKEKTMYGIGYHGLIYFYRLWYIGQK